VHLAILGLHARMGGFLEAAIWRFLSSCEIMERFCGGIIIAMKEGMGMPCDYLMM
jgi:hypothetical protein